jgi:dienelactone hydrolase
MTTRNQAPPYSSSQTSTASPQSTTNCKTCTPHTPVSLFSDAHSLADHLALATLFPVIMPDLFNNDPVPMTMTEGPQLNLTSWFARHPTWQIDRVVEQTLLYMQTQLGVERIGAVGYCLGGKHVARFMADGKGIELGFVAHPANLTDEEVQAIAGPASVAAGGMSSSFPLIDFSWDV